MEQYAVEELVKAARMSWNLAKHMNQLFIDANLHWTVADEIFGMLKDVLASYAEEQPMDCSGDREYESWKLLMSDLDAETVADMISQMREKNRPKPNLTDPKETEKNYQKNGGYRHEPDKKETGIRDAVKAYEKLNRMTALYKAGEEENVKMRTILLQVAEEKCSGCWRKENGLCGVTPCRWERVKKGDFT